MPPCESAPQDLIDYVKEKQEMPGSPMVGNMVWLSCEGENPADRENLGPVKYYPEPGIRKYYFPYRNQPGYLSPLVFAHLENPKRKSVSQSGGSNLVLVLISIPSAAQMQIR